MEQDQLKAKISELEKREDQINSRDASFKEKFADFSKREKFIQNNEKINTRQSEKTRILRMQLEAKRRDLERERSAFSKLVESKRLGDDLTRLLQEGGFGVTPTEEQVQKMKIDLEKDIRQELESEFEEKLRVSMESSNQSRIQVL